MKTYTLHQEHKEQPPGVEVALCAMEVTVEVVCKWFALRSEYVPHPAGEDLMMESWILDHMPTGKRLCGGGWLNPVGREQCKKLAEALVTTPVDWSVEGVETSDGFKEWFGKARDAAAHGDVLPWPEHLPTGRHRVLRDGGTDD